LLGFSKSSKSKESMSRFGTDMVITTVFPFFFFYPFSIGFLTTYTYNTGIYSEKKFDKIFGKKKSRF